MGRLGTRDAAEATAVAEAVAAAPGLELIGAMTHFATADDDPAFAREQLAGFLPWARALADRHPRAAPPRRELRRHARHPRVAPGPRPLRDRHLRHGPLRRLARRRTGWSRRSSCAPTSRRSSASRRGRARATGAASSRTRRRGSAPCPSATPTACAGRSPTTPTCSSAAAACRSSGRSRWTTSRSTSARATRPPVGEPVVLLGRQGGERVLAEEWARRLGTIPYEITCAISGRVPREHHR